MILGTVELATRRDHLRAGADNAAPLRIATHHEAVDVMQEDERNQVLIAVHDEARRLFRTLGINHAAELNPLFPRLAGMRLVGLLVGDDPYREATDPAISAKHRLAVIRLVFVEFRTVDQPGNHLVHVVAVACTLRRIGIEQGIQFLRRKLGRILLRIVGRPVERRPGSMAQPGRPEIEAGPGTGGHWVP